MTLDEFVTQWTGKFADFDGAYGAQCVDLFNYYNRDVVGAPFIGTPLTGGAADLWENFSSSAAPEFYDQIRNTPDLVVQEGDVVVWAANTPRTGPAGHVAIGLAGADTNQFTSFDQNYPDGSLPHKQQHDYVGVYGVLRPNNLAKQGTDEMIESQDELQALFGAFWGRPASADEVSQYVGKVSFIDMVRALDRGLEHQAVANAYQVGRVAIRDDWRGQITRLTAQNTQLSAPAAASPGPVDSIQAPGATVVLAPASTSAGTGKQENFFATTSGRALIGLVATAALPALNALTSGGTVSKESLQAAGTIFLVAAMQSVKDLLNPGVPNSTNKE